jgi:hypothetical protein
MYYSPRLHHTAQDYPFGRVFFFLKWFYSRFIHSLMLRSVSSYVSFSYPLQKKPIQNWQQIQVATYLHSPNSIFSLPVGNHLFSTGLYLRARENGKRVWLARVKVDSKETMIKLGELPGMTLSGAKKHMWPQKLTPTEVSQSTLTKQKKTIVAR